MGAPYPHPRSMAYPVVELCEYDIHTANIFLARWVDPRMVYTRSAYLLSFASLIQLNKVAQKTAEEISYMI